MAGELVQVMADLGHEGFAVVRHDRGARVAYRMALDHPEAVDRLAVFATWPTRPRSTPTTGRPTWRR